MKIKQRHFWLLARGSFVLTFCLVLFAQLTITPAATRAQSATPDPALQVLALLNQWRIEQGLWPFKLNPTLAAMAIAQSSYLAPKLSSVQDESDYHQDIGGRNPQQRAAQPPYNWPTYGSPTRIEIGENAAVGSPLFAVNFWKGSDIHRRAALNADYREIGIAAARVGSSYLFITDFGARPGVLTALESPGGDKLYLSDERSPYATPHSGALQVRLFDADGHALTDATPWQPTIPLPAGLHGSIYVLYSSGDYQALSAVNLTTDVVALPESLLAATTVTQPPPTAVTRAATQTVSAGPTDTPMPVSPRMMTIIAATSAPPTRSSIADLLILYNSRWLVVYNNASKPLDLTGISIVGSSGKLTVANWAATAFFPVSAFPSAQCLQAQVAGAFDQPPGSCKFVRSLVQVSSSKAFWTQGAFTVNRNDTTVLANCDAASGRCEVALR